MRKLTITAAGVLAALAFTAPASAHDNDWNSRHEWQHDRLDQRHDDVHDQLDYEHAEAHEQGLSPWDHRQLHRELQYQHQEADYRIERQHERQHRRDGWRRRNWNYSYYGY